MAPTPESKLSSSKYPMDTGYSWLVLGSSFLINLIILGQVINFGIYFVNFMEYFESSRKATSLAGAITYALMCLLGPLSGVLQKRYGTRKVIICGALLSTMGMTLSYFATELWHLYLTYGLLCGLGYGLCLSPSLTVIPEYFERHRYFCTTFTSIGASLGSLIFAPFTMYLVETYTWRGSMLIQAGLCFQIIVFGTICKSRILHKDTNLRSLFELGIFKHRLFLLLLVDGAVLGGTSFTVFSLINSLAISRGLTIWQSAELVSVAGFSNTAARILAAVISNLRCTDRTAFYCGVSFLLVAGVAGCVFSYDFWTFVASLFAFGFSLGVKFSQPPNVIIDLFGVDKVVSGLGYYLFSIGFGGFLLPLLAGWLADQTETKNAFVLACGSCTLGFIACCLLLILRRTKKSPTTAADTNEDFLEVRQIDRAISVD